MTKRYLRQIITFSLGIFTLVSMCLPHSAWASVAGRFQFVAGDVRIVSADGRERPAIKGGEVNEKESILSGKTGSAQLRMVDDGIVAVRPETSLRIDEYKLADKESGAERGFFSLLKGGFRSITGLIGRGNKDSYGIRTPSATIGIRGTDHETVHLTTALPNLPEGTYNKVNTGATVVNGTLVGANQVAYAPNLSTPAAILPHIPPIFEAPKGGQQGRDDRKRDADKTDGKQQAKDEKKQETGQKPANGQPAPATTAAAAPAPTDGSTQPPPAPANGTTQPPPPPVGGPMPPPPPTNLIGSTLLPPPPPPNTTLITGTTGSGAVTSGGASLAPIGSGIVGGDISIRTECNQAGSTCVTGPVAGNGAIIVEGPNQTILFDTATKRPILVAEQNSNGGMQYTSGTAQFIETGQATVGTAKVIWGRYVGAGDQFIDPQSTRDPITMNLMFTDQAMNYIQASNYFTGPNLTANFNLSAPIGGNVIDDRGAAYSLNPGGTLVVNMGGATASQITLSVATNTVQGRNWNLSYQGSLQQFYKGSCSSGSCGLPIMAGSTLNGTATTWVRGEASGLFIGSAAAGALTSFSATTTGGASILGTSLFIRQ